MDYLYIFVDTQAKIVILKWNRIGLSLFGMATIWIIPDSVQPIKYQTLVLLLLRILFDRKCMSSIKYDKSGN